jgi:putative zinc finger protein
MICDAQTSGTTELYFYGELTPAERDAFERHLAGCEPCRCALEELATIRAALAARPAVSAPPDGDWSAFMSRLDRATEEDGQVRGPFDSRGSVRSLRASRAALGRRSYVGYLAMAALLALVTMSVAIVIRSRSPELANGTARVEEQAPPGPIAADPAGERQAFAELSEEHFEKSKLVVLGLTTKDAGRATSRDWTYERQLASALLADTRMYRMAAEDRGLESLAGVMSDLEVVLLQTSLTDETDPASLGQIQRLIHKRDLLEKMEVVNHLGLAP